MKSLELKEMEDLQGGVNGACIATVGAAIGLFAWSLSVPLTGGISLGLGLTGAGLTLTTIGGIVKCAE